jgi:23S rRNA (cytidine1920-2'-O)/16S rRNA (cytidine1409-2'-O)-methyltransferase
MGKRERLDLLLVQRELVSSREEGRRRILAAEVLVNEQPLTKAGALVDQTAEVRLKAASAYVSRGGLKLEKALRLFQIDVKDKVALDVGASTGGFTHCLLSHGAARVYSVDCGYGQLDWKLRTDPRVVVLERRNIRYLEASDLPSLADFATIDVSFISLRLVLPKMKTLVSPGGEIIALIKPQFEVGKGKVGKGGVVRSDAEHLRVIDEIEQTATGLGFTTRNITESPLLGAKGNKEFLIHLTDPDFRS